MADKVYVMTKARAMQPEQYIGVKSSKKGAMKALREIYPHMRSMNGKDGDLVSDAEQSWLLFIHEEVI